MNTLRRLGFILISIVLVGAVLSFFGNPTAVNSVNIVDASTELNAPEFKGFNDAEFGNKVVNSTWAMVLVHSDFSNDNAAGLEALRNWAKRNFTLDRHFLNPILLPEARSSSTVLGSLANSVFGLPIKLLDNTASQFLKWRVNSFHNSNAYQSFRVDFYELFGANEEAVKLLFAYQEQRAKNSILVLQSSLFWLVTALLITVNHFRMKKIHSRSVLRRSLAYFWSALAVFYLLSACITNNVEIFASSIISSIVAIYLAFPIVIQRKENGSLTWLKYELSARAQLILCWLTFSLFGIQVINWIKAGILTNPDPVTLLIGAITGNFLHDPIGIKRSISEAVGIIWLGFSLVTVYFYKTRTERSQEMEKELASLSKQKVLIQ